MSSHWVGSGGISRRTFFLLPVLLLPRLVRATESLSFDTLYKSIGVLGIKYSDKALALKSQAVQMRGYMAPPLKPESNFFVLTREPVSVCPFCASDAEWPVDIVVIYLKGTLAPVNFSKRIDVEGRLEIGSWIDPHTGFVSQVRLVDAEVRKQ
jgi:hypothetical protein